jgi:hypothetical protein
MFLAAIVMLQLQLLRLEGKSLLQDILTLMRDLMPVASAMHQLAETKLTIVSMTLAVHMLKKRRTSIPFKSVVMLPTKKRYVP